MQHKLSRFTQVTLSVIVLVSLGFIGYAQVREEPRDPTLLHYESVLQINYSGVTCIYKVSSAEIQTPVVACHDSDGVEVYAHRALILVTRLGDITSSLMFPSRSN